MFKKIVILPTISIAFTSSSVIEEKILKEMSISLVVRKRQAKGSRPYTSLSGDRKGQRGEAVAYAKNTIFLENSVWKKCQKLK